MLASLSGILISYRPIAKELYASVTRVITPYVLILRSYHTLWAYHEKLSYREMWRAVIKALLPHFGEEAICSDDKPGMLWRWAIFEVDQSSISDLLIVCDLRMHSILLSLLVVHIEKKTVFFKMLSIGHIFFHFFSKKQSAALYVITVCWDEKQLNMLQADG